MILRHIADAIRTQNWFTVFIEFTLVVAGVLVALQFDNWNEGRKFDAMERDYLLQLRDEISANETQIKIRIQYTADIVAAGNRALAFLQKDRPCQDNCTQLLVDFFHATQVWGISSHTSVYTEMKRLGLPRSSSVKKAADGFYSVFEGLGVSIENLPEYRRQARNAIPVAAIDLLWVHCHVTVSSEFETLIQDCVPKLDSVNAGPIIETLRRLPGLQSNLNGWIGQNAFAHRNYKVQSKSFAVAIAAIDAELERTK